MTQLHIQSIYSRGTSDWLLKTRELSGGEKFPIEDGYNVVWTASAYSDPLAVQGEPDDLYVTRMSAPENRYITGVGLIPLSSASLYFNFPETPIFVSPVGALSMSLALSAPNAYNYALMKTNKISETEFISAGSIWGTSNYTGSGQLLNTTSGYTSAYWFVPLSGFIDSGVFYSTSGNVDIIGSWFTPNVAYNWNDTVNYTNSQLLSVWTSQTTSGYYVSAHVYNGAVAPGNLVASGSKFIRGIAPKELQILEVDAFVNTASICAIRNWTVLGDTEPYDTIVWETSTPLLFNFINNDGSLIYSQWVTSTYSGSAFSAQYVQISASYSDGPSGIIPTSSFQITASVIPVNTVAWTVTSDTYVFDFTRVNSDELIIVEEDVGNKFAEIKTRRYVNQTAPYYDTSDSLYWWWNPTSNINVSSYDETNSLWIPYTIGTLVWPSTGGDRLYFETSAPDNQTFTVYVTSSLRPSITSSYQFTQQFHTTEVSAVQLGYDNSTRVESVTAKAYSIVNGLPVNIHPDANIYWDITLAANTTAWANLVNGDAVLFRQATNEDTIVYRLSTSVFNTPPETALNFTLSTAILSAGVHVTSDTINYTTSTFPGPDLFNPQFSVQYNPCSSTNRLYLLSSGSTQAISGIDYTLASGTNSSVSGSRVWDFGDGSTVTSNSKVQTHTYSLSWPGPISFNIDMSAVNVQSTYWTGSKTLKARC